MKRFCIAGLEVELRGDFDHMLGYYSEYPSSGGPVDLVIEIERRSGFAESRPRGPQYPAFVRCATETGVSFERFDALGHVDAGATHARFVVGDSPNSLEAAIRISVASALPRKGALIFHASGIERDGRAQLFLGVSGAGKSTIAELLSQSGAGRKISDELVIARVGRRAEAVVAPFIGSVGLPHGERFELVALNFLVQAREHQRRALDAAESLPQLLRHAVSFANTPARIGEVMDLATELLDAVCAYELHFAPSADVATAIGLT